MKRSINAFLFLFLSASGFAQSKADSVNIFAYFKNNGEDGLHMAASTDGYHWNTLKHDSSFLTPTVAKDKLMRDPCIIQGPDKVYRMVWTVSWKDKEIGYASSTDLVHWLQQQFIPVMAHEAGAQNCWAPEITYDAKNRNYMIYWSTTIPGRFPATDTLGDYNHRLYYVTTKDFVQFTKAKLLYDPGFNSIDATIQKHGNKYVMIFKDETLKPVAHKNLKIAFSKKLTSGYGKPSLLLQSKEWAEGPTVLRLNGKWLVYFDKYMNGKYGALESSDLINWADVSDQISLPKGIRHGTILKISAEAYQKLLAEM